MLIRRPNLVRELNMIDSPGESVIRKIIQPHNNKELYSKVNVINTDPGIINTVGTHSNFANTYIVRCDSHKLDKIIEAYKQNGAFKVSSEFFNAEGWLDANGNYYYQEKNLAFSEDDVAKRFGISVEKVRDVPQQQAIDEFPSKSFQIKLGDILKGDKKE